jgi:hypothetical protein
MGKKQGKGTVNLSDGFAKVAHEGEFIVREDIGCVGPEGVS